eukprot:3565475-Prymnesium_polylepis.2
MPSRSSRRFSQCARPFGLEPRPGRIARAAAIGAPPPWRAQLDPPPRTGCPPRMDAAPIDRRGPAPTPPSSMRVPLPKARLPRVHDGAGGSWRSIAALAPRDKCLGNESRSHPADQDAIALPSGDLQRAGMGPNRVR